MVILIPCLVRLRTEFNLIAPNRSTVSDGWIGDTAHQDRVSDHNPDETGAVPIHDADTINEVHAVDVTTDLNESDLTMEKVIQFTLSRCRRANSDPNNEARLRYIIFNGRIWEAPDWRQSAYTGADQHTGHAHFSAEYVSSLEADTSTWHLEEIPVALTAADKAWFRSQMDDAIADAFATTEQSDGTPTSKVGRDAWNQGIPNGLVLNNPRDKAWDVMRDMGVKLADMSDSVAEVEAKVDDILAAIVPPTT